jgi:hypothetical protein
MIRREHYLIGHCGRRNTAGPHDASIDLPWFNGSGTEVSKFQVTPGP